MVKNIKLQLFLAIVLVTKPISAQNPIVKDIGMSDPHIRVFNDTVFLYCGHDDSPNDKTWVMKEWRVFSTTNLLDWTQRGTIPPKDNYMDDNSTDCWAADASTRNGKYYFYFSDRKRGVGVMTSDQPTGPFKDALGKPLVSPMHDPTILVDDDKNKTPYLVYGDKEGGGFHIARLNEDIISVAETPKPITINGEEWKNAPQWMDKNYIFKHKDTYYLSWGRDYAISKNIYGPYQSVGAVGNGHNLSEYAHGSFFWWNGQFYHIWCYYIRPGYKYRESIITYCHFDDEGKIVTDTYFLDKHFENGVGQYDASWDKIEAEWFYEKTPELQKQGNREKGFVIKGFKNGSWLRFDNIDFEKGFSKFSANISGEGKGKIEIRLDSPNGKLIGTIKLNQNEEKTSCVLETIYGKKDVYIKYSGKKNTFKLDSFKFSN